MIQIFFFILILLLPASSDAAYKIYLKNGSVISGVSSYEKKGGDVTIYFGGGSIGISQKDILRIEETETPAKDLRSKEVPEIQEKQEKTEDMGPPPQSPADDKSARMNALKAELDAVNAEIRTAEQEEAGLTASINEKRGRRFKYNIIQLKQLEKEIEPLQQELFTIQQKKKELIERKNSLEGEIRAL